jgi:hypothetical protein
MTETRTGKRIVFLAGLLFSVSLGLQWYVIATQRIPLSSDQAVVGLMAKHILSGKGHPVFIYGSTYGGTLEPHYVACVFALLGTSTDAYRAAMALLLLLTMAGIFAVTGRSLGWPAALVALAYLSVPPFFFLYKGLTSDGAYDAFNLLVVASLAFCWSFDRSLQQGRPLWPTLGALGFVSGVAWWVMPLALPVTAVVLLWLFVRAAPRPPLSVSSAFLVGGLAGSFPWWFWNLRHGWASLKAPELGRESAGGALAHLGLILSRSLPILAGGGQIRHTYFHVVFPYSRFLVLLLLAGILTFPLRDALRGDRFQRLLFLTLLAVVFTAMWPKRLVPTEPRYLFSYYALVPPLVGAGLVSVGRRRGSRRVAWGLGAILLLVHASSIRVAYRHLKNDDTQVTAPLTEVLHAIQEAGVKYVYANYWTAYRLTFESDERIIATPIPGEEAIRYEPYEKEVGSTPEASFVLLSPRSGCFESYLHENDLAYRRTDVREFAIFSKVAPEALDFVRRHGALPLPEDGYRVGWRIESTPPMLPARGQATARVSFLNESPCSWSRVVHVGYHWRPRDSEGQFIRDGGRAIPDRRVNPGEWATVEVFLKAPDRPGRYRLEYDLVFEGVKWFSERGGAIASVPIDIR